MERANLRCDKLKWDSNNMTFERDKTGGYTWPQRNYLCAFCKKQFKSAQALGGHMNVHRRERAQLRSLHSTNSLDYGNPNPNPSFLPYASCQSSLITSLVPLSSKSSDPIFEESMLLKPHSQLDQRKKMRNGAFLGFEKLKSFTQEEDHEPRVFNKMEKIERLELGMGFVRDGKEDLDLELRLGFS